MIDGNGKEEVDFFERFRSKRPPPPRTTPAKRKRKPRRPPIPTPYGSIPYAYTDKLQDAAPLEPTWALLFHLDRLIYGPTRKEPLTITDKVCRSFRLTRKQVRNALRRLERAGLITLRRLGGRSFDVFPLWRVPPS
jgi:hypothetical protein